MTRPTLNSADLIRRLREQAQAPGHVWTDVMRLLLEAADALENSVHKPCDEYAHHWFPQRGDGPIMCLKCGEHRVRYTSLTV